VWTAICSLMVVAAIFSAGRQALAGLSRMASAGQPSCIKKPALMCDRRLRESLSTAQAGIVGLVTEDNDRAAEK
jgi:hypothetical protein